MTTPMFLASDADAADYAEWRDGPDTAEPAPEPWPRTSDPEAPYGRNPAGQPYKMPKEKRDALTARLQAGRANARDAVKGVPTRRRKASSGTRAPRSTPKAPVEPPYREAIAGLLQLPAALLAGAARFQRHPVDQHGEPIPGWIPSFTVDAATITLFTPDLAEAGHELAMQDPRVAAVLDRVLQAGPWTAILAVGAQLAVQIAVNHRMLPAGMGLSAGDIIDRIDPPGDGNAS